MTGAGRNGGEGGWNCDLSEDTRYMRILSITKSLYLMIPHLYARHLLVVYQFLCNTSIDVFPVSISIYLILSTVSVCFSPATPSYRPHPHGWGLGTWAGDKLPSLLCLPFLRASSKGRISLCTWKLMPDSLRDRRGARNFESRESTIDTQSSTLKTSTKRTLSWFDIPDWQRDNEYILSGYRRWVLGHQQATAKIHSNHTPSGCRTAGLGVPSRCLDVRSLRFLMLAGWPKLLLFRSPQWNRCDIFT